MFQIQLPPTPLDLSGFSKPGQTTFAPTVKNQPSTPTNVAQSPNFGNVQLNANQETYKQALLKSDPDLYNKFNEIDPTLLDFLISNSFAMGIDPKLILSSVDAETGGYSAEQMKKIVSSAGAAGINQVMKVTYDHVMKLIDAGTAKLPPGVSKEDLASYQTNPKANLIVSMIYLRDAVVPEVKKMPGMENIDIKNLSPEQIGKILGAYNQGPYGFRESGGANNSETRNHIEKTTQFARNLTQNLVATA